MYTVSTNFRPNTIPVRDWSRSNRYNSNWDIFFVIKINKKSLFETGNCVSDSSFQWMIIAMNDFVDRGGGGLREHGGGIICIVWWDAAWWINSMNSLLVSSCSYRRIPTVIITWTRVRVLIFHVNIKYTHLAIWFPITYPWLILTMYVHNVPLISIVNLRSDSYTKSYFCLIQPLSRTTPQPDENGLYLLSTIKSIINHTIYSDPVSHV